PPPGVNTLRLCTGIVAKTACRLYPVALFTDQPYGETLITTIRGLLRGSFPGLGVSGEDGIGRSITAICLAGCRFFGVRFRLRRPGRIGVLRCWISANRPARNRPRPFTPRPRCGVLKWGRLT